MDGIKINNEDEQVFWTGLHFERFDDETVTKAIAQHKTQGWVLSSQEDEDIVEQQKLMFTQLIFRHT